MNTAYALAGHLLAILITGILFGAGYPIFPSEWNGVALDVAGDDSTTNSHAWRALVKDQSNNLLASKLPTQNERTVSALPLTIVYQSPVNCLTQANLVSMQTFEESVLKLAADTKICQLSSLASACQSPESVLRFFDGTFESWNITVSGVNVFRPDPSFARITEIIQTAYAQNGGSSGSGNNLRKYLDYELSTGKRTTLFNCSIGQGFMHEQRLSCACLICHLT
jgi:hypothetical protein